MGFNAAAVLIASFLVAVIEVGNSCSIQNI
jgi:hypothetical protein